MDIKNTSMALEFPVWNFKPVGSRQAVSLSCLVAGAEERSCKMWIILVETQSLFKFVLVPGPSTLADKAQGPFSVSSNKRETRTSKKWWVTKNSKLMNKGCTIPWSWSKQKLFISQPCLGKETLFMTLIRDSISFYLLSFQFFEFFSGIFGLIRVRNTVFKSV